MPGVSRLRRRRRSRLAKSAPNFRHQCRMLSWVTTTPRSARISSTSRKAEAEDVIQPDRVTDDLRRKPVPGIRGSLRVHAGSPARLPPKRQTRGQLANAQLADPPAGRTAARGSFYLAWLVAPAMSLATVDSGPTTSRNSILSIGIVMLTGACQSLAMRSTSLLVRSLVFVSVVT